MNMKEEKNEAEKWMNESCDTPSEKTPKAEEKVNKIGTFGKK